jgi:tetratricopeptide (TPR) repeat protein
MRWLAAAALLLVAAAPAETDEKRCTDKMEAPDLRLGACARLIESGRYKDDKLKLATWHFNRAFAHMSNRDDDLALAELNRVMAVLPEASVAANTRGDLHYKHGRYKEAAEDFALSARNDPDWGLPLDNLGLTYTQLRQYDRAIDAFTRALTKAQNWSAPYENRAYAYAQLKRHDEALADIDNAIAINSTNHFSYRTRGQVLYAMEKYKDAVAAFDKGLVRNPQDAWGYAGRALALYRDKDTSRGRKDVEMVQKLQPADAWIANHLCYQLAIADHAKDGLPQCDRALALLPDPEIYDSRGFAYLRLQRPEDALKDYNQTLAKNPKHAYAMYGRCVALAQLKQTREAQIDCEDARGLNPEAEAFFASHGLTPR